MKANVIYIISGRDYRRAVAVQYDENEDILNDNREGVDIDTENVDDMYIVCDEEKAKKAVELFNENTEQDMSEIIKNMEEIVMESGMTEVYQELEYEREDPERDNYRIARMDKSKRDEIEKMTDDIYERLQEYHEFMRRMVGDGAYTHNIQQVQHHFGQIRGDLFDPLSGLM